MSSQLHKGELYNVNQHADALCLPKTMVSFLSTDSAILIVFMMDTQDPFEAREKLAAYSFYVTVTT